MAVKNDEANVWQAWHKQYEEPHYFVGHYNTITCCFWRSATKAEKERNPKLVIVSGTFAEMAQHTRVGKDNYHNARVMAYEQYGYSKKDTAPENAYLGTEYGLKKMVIV